MYTLHLTGFPHLTYGGREVECSRKGLALLCFLVLERGKTQSRETLTSLLWDAPHATSQRNLRVELSKLRASGLSLPSHELSVEALSTDLERLESLWPESESQVLEALQGVGDRPLSSLAEVGTPVFREWVEGWQSVLRGALETVLQRWYALAANQSWEKAKKAVLDKSRTLDFRLRMEPSHPGTRLLGTQHSGVRALRAIHFPRPELERVLLSALETAESRSLLVSLCGPAGSGKSYLAHWLSRQTTHPALLTLSVTCAPSSRLTLALLAAELLPHLRGPARESVQAVRSGLQEQDSDLLRLSTALEGLGRPLLLIFEQAQAASPDLMNLLEFWLSTLPSGLLLILSREDSIPSEITRNLRCSLTLGTRLELHELHLGSLGLESVQQGLHLLEHPELERPETGDYGLTDETLLAHANQLLQRSDGNVQHLLTLLEEERITLQDEGPSPQIQHIYLSEVRHWPEPLYQALRYLSALHTTFDEARASALLRRMNLEQPSRLLSQALERGILHPVRPERALVFPYWTPFEDAPAQEERFEFGRETLRIALAATLPQPLRQELRRHLVELLEFEDPGLASYYAQRTGQLERAEQLLTLHRQRLAAGSPLLGGAPGLRSWSHLSSVPPPACHPGPGRSLREQGYAVALESGWLSVRRRGRYGHADTLRLLFTLPTPAPVEPRAGVLKLTWRLDVFNGGYDMWPSKVPFPLRLRLLSQGQYPGKQAEHAQHAQPAQPAHLLSPEQLETFFDEGLEQRVYPDVKLDGWMEHSLELEHPPEGALLELSVRALDVALVVGNLEWNGQNLLSLDMSQLKIPTGRKTYLR